MSSKLREALSKASIALSWATHSHLTEGDAEKCLAIVEAALADPVLNCEFGTEEEQIERWKEFCNKFKKCHGCPYIREGEILSSLSARCFARWAQMPYEEVK